jgi:hypothetical protein
MTWRLPEEGVSPTTKHDNGLNSNQLSSSSLDLAELEPKPVDHRQNPTDPVLVKVDLVWIECRVDSILTMVNWFRL